MRLTDFDLFSEHDAAELALTLHHRHLGHFAAAAELDPTGRCLRVAVHDEPWSSIETALDAARAAIAADDRITAIALASSAELDAPGGRVAPDDVLRFDVAERELADLGVELIDWVQTNGIDTVSLSGAILDTRWADGPP
jgi:hypothetical protein